MQVADATTLIEATFKIKYSLLVVAPVQPVMFSRVILFEETKIFTASLFYNGAERSGSKTLTNTGQKVLRLV
jgi:hypothetical protein